MERYKESNLFKSLKELYNAAPSNIFDDGQTLTEPKEIANNFKKYFCY